MECMWKLQMMVILIDLLILYQNQVHEKTETFCFFILSETCRGTLSNGTTTGCICVSWLDRIKKLLL